jgi:hypothetical protein
MVNLLADLRKYEVTLQNVFGTKSGISLETRVFFVVAPISLPKKSELAMLSPNEQETQPSCTTFRDKT